MTAHTGITMLRAATARQGWRVGHATTILAWAFTVYMIHGYLLVPFDRFESTNQEVCEAARAEAEEIAGMHDGWTVVVGEQCTDTGTVQGADTEPHETEDR